MMLAYRVRHQPTVPGSITEGNADEDSLCWACLGMLPKRAHTWSLLQCIFVDFRGIYVGCPCIPSQIILRPGPEYRHVLHEALFVCLLLVNVRLPFQIEQQGWPIMSYFRALK